MSWISARLNRLRAIVAEAIKRNINPDKTGFADYVISASSTLAVTEKTARGYVHTLIKAYHHNKWLSYVRFNPYLSKEEQEKWIKTHSKTP